MEWCPNSYLSLLEKGFYQEPKRVLLRVIQRDIGYINNLVSVPKNAQGGHIGMPPIQSKGGACDADVFVALKMQ